MAKPLTEEQISTKKAALVQIAMALLESDGFDALTLRNLAKEAGISRSTPYSYFKDKAELCQCVCAETFRYLIRKCAIAMEESDGYAEQLTAIGRCYLDFGIERPILYQLVFAPVHAQEEKLPELIEVIDEYMALTEVPMRKAYEEGIISYPPERLNPVLWACSHGLLSLRWAGHLSEEGMYDRVQEDLKHILAFGFMHGGKP
ncbi:MAG: TetR/AcrR family transcriptional regulator [Sneathiella sp.]